MASATMSHAFVGHEKAASDRRLRGRSWGQVHDLEAEKMQREKAEERGATYVE